MNQLTAIAIANMALIGSIMLFFYKSWLDQIRPDWFYIFRIYENKMLNYQEKKIFLPISGKKDAYTFDGCEYNKTGVAPYIDPKGVYTWNFCKGLNTPIGFFDNAKDVDGKLVETVKKTGKEIIDDIVAGESGMEDFIKTWGIVIVGLILLLAIGYLITKNQESSRLTTELLINISRRG